MSAIKAFWARCKATIGAAGIIGVVGCLAAALAYAALLHPREKELERLELAAKAVAARPQPAQAARPEDRMKAFDGYFPAAGTLQDWIERINAAAAGAGVAVERMDYRLVPEQTAGLVRYQIALPARGTYAQIRGLAAALLEAVPTLALTDIEMKRDAISGATLEARLNLTLFLRGGQR